MFSFTEIEKDLILLGVNQIIRTDETGTQTTYNVNTYGVSGYQYVIIKERILNGGNLDLKTIYTANISLLLSTYPSVYQIYTSTISNPQTINVSSTYII